ncbi:MAG: flagellar M-ring protein FliF C-terminal domain-containing protein, partial [Pseudomonadota bacterium]
GGGDDSASKFAIVEKSDQTTNYEISKTVKNYISESGVIKKMSIGILVDGHYETDPETEDTKYTPRSQEDLDKIENLVKVAVGFDDDRSDRIEVINMKFSAELDPFGDDDSDWIKDELPGLFQTLIFAIVVLLVLITVIRPIALKAFEVRKSEEYDGEGGLEGADIAASVSGVPGAPGGAVPNAVTTPPVDGEALETSAPKIDPVVKVNEIADSSPQDLVNVLRKWLNEDG